MIVIYKIINLKNNKCYIGQSRDWKQRYRHYCSNPFNPNASEYNRPIDFAIRKYGLDSFSFELIEIFQEDIDQDEIDKKEIFWIKECKSLVSENGYNIETGGIRGARRVPLTYEQSLLLSKKFTPQEIKDIQKLLLEDKTYSEIQHKYDINLTFLSNINNGHNFFNPNFEYPLKKDFHKSKYTKEEISGIKDMVKSGCLYKDIAKKYKIQSEGFISGINSGKYFFDKKETYPLIIKSCSRKYNMETWVRGIKKDLIFTDFSFSTIEKKYGKKKGTVARINRGQGYKENKFIYPLRNNKEYNQNHF